MGDATCHLNLSFCMSKGCEALHLNALDTAMLCHVIN